MKMYIQHEGKRSIDLLR